MKLMGILHSAFRILHYLSSALFNNHILGGYSDGDHLFPFRTEKLSPPAPMVLQCNVGE